MWNMYGTPERFAEADATLRAACRAIGRDTREIVRTINANTVIRDDPADALAAWEGWRTRHRPDADEQGRELVGSPGNVLAALRRYEAVGVRESVWIFRTPFDLETMDRLPEIRLGLAGRAGSPPVC
jgi:alkanesulfonate monooxygenase SsuD/methylene tetrahydromethanopterin reductase-like flavin-dependent oxidoreductase (luciferase family)